jgi:gamma-glutamylcyclotransferase
MSPSLYFGYGSNLWLHQMAVRCPSSPYLGVARLSSYRWIINSRGYANVVETKSSSDIVYGLVYTLTPADEARLDVNEGVPVAYTKETLPCAFWKADSENRGKVDVDAPPTEEAKEMLVYIDRKRMEPAEPKGEYVVRMNKGIVDAVKMGVPKDYVDEVMRRFIPESGGEGAGKREEMEAKALRQATRFEDESGVMASEARWMDTLKQEEIQSGT